MASTIKIKHEVGKHEDGIPVIRQIIETEDAVIQDNAIDFATAQAIDDKLLEKWKEATLAEAKESARVINLVKTDDAQRLVEARRLQTLASNLASFYDWKQRTPPPSPSATEPDADAES